MNVALHGHSPDEGLVALQQLDETTIRLYKRLNGEIRSVDERFFPFFFLSDDQYLREFKAPYWLKKLAGSNHYRFLAVFERWSDFWQAIRAVLSSYNRTHSPRASTYSDLEVLLVRSDPLTQYLTQSGKTLFKGMTLEDLNRMQFEIQTKGPKDRSGSPRRSENAVTAIALCDSSGWETVLESGSQGEPGLLKEFATIVSERDPDVLEGYGLFDVSLPFLIGRAELHGIHLELGRDRSVARMTTQRGGVSEAERVMIEIAGRHLVDIEGLVHVYDYSKRSFEAYTLAHAAEHFGFKADSSRRGKGAKGKESEKLLDRARAIRYVGTQLLPSYVVLAQFCPLPFGTVTRSGSAQKIESLLVREYLRQKHSVPRATRGSHATGGYAALFHTGVIDSVTYADVESLYPSIMVRRSIGPASDELRVFPSLLGDLLTMRIGAKRQMNASSDPDERRRADALQSALKILVNSFYGYLGYSRGLFNDYRKADEVTTTGQAVLKEIVRQIELYNGLMIEADTDGVFFVPPDNVQGAEQERAFIQRISETLPEKVSLVPAGKFRKMFSYRKKNYALLTMDGQLIVRGSSLISRSLEPFARQFIRQAIGLAFAGNLQGLHALYVTLKGDITNHRWEVADFARVEGTHESLEAYERAIRDGTRKPSAAYEAAKRAQRYVSAGQMIAYYVTGSIASVKISERSRLGEEWDRNFADENTAYYLERLEDCLEKFRDLFEPQDFTSVFSDADLFGFDPAGITLRVKKVEQPVEASEVADDESPEPRIGIWLDE
jgi:DNA polymerase elongation subunit (family B)